MFGILLIDKPQGITSHGVISRLRRVLGTRRIGHAGTLDPLATGLLVVAVGPATRFLQYLDLEPKTYEAAIRFGVETDTYDAEGEITASTPTPPNLADEIAVNIKNFIGELQQIPPVFSAIKLQGKPLYAYARRGEDVAVKPRKVFISEYRLKHMDGDTGQFEVICSGGTYVRSLAHDLGRAVGCGAHIAGLRRTGAGAFDVSRAIPLEEVSAAHLIPVKEALAHLPQIFLNPSQIDHIRHGRSIQVQNPLLEPKAALLTPEGNVLGIGAVVKETMLHPECVIPAEVFDSLTSTQ